MFYESKNRHLTYMALLGSVYLNQLKQEKRKSD